MVHHGPQMKVITEQRLFNDLLTVERNLIGQDVGKKGVNVLLERFKTNWTPGVFAG
jgi:hypothetical protein